MSLVPSKSDPDMFWFTDNVTNQTFSVTDLDLTVHARTGFVSEILYSVLGTLINLWFLLAILTSKELRARLRNKLLCNVLVLHLVISALISPLKLIIPRFAGLGECESVGLVLNLIRIQDFIANWLLVILIAAFIAQILDFDLRTTWTSLAQKLGTWALLAVPWLLSIILVPFITHLHSRHVHNQCLIPNSNTLRFFSILDTAIPIMVQIVLVSIAAILRTRRFRYGSSTGSGRAELLNGGPLIDPTVVYVAAVIVCILCDCLRLLHLFYSIYNFFIRTQHNLLTASQVLDDARVVLMPLPWLLLPDIRERIKTWRPCCRSAHSRPTQSTDVTVLYRKNGACEAETL